MNESLRLVLSAVAGLALGTVFFGGLWWTVQQAVSSPLPALWFLGSLLLRMALCLGGFYLVGHGDFKRMIACVCGFFIARLMVTVMTRPPVNKEVAPVPEVSRAT